MKFKVDNVVAIGKFLLKTLKVHLKKTSAQVLFYKEKKENSIINNKKGHVSVFASSTKT